MDDDGAPLESRSNLTVHSMIDAARSRKPASDREDVQT